MGAAFGAGAGVEPLGFAHEALARFLEHVADRGRDEFVLGGEVRVEAAVGEAGLGHHRGDADALGAGRADRAGCRVEHALARVPLVVAVVAHGATLIVDMMIII